MWLETDGEELDQWDESLGPPLGEVTEFVLPLSEYWHMKRMVEP